MHKICAALATMGAAVITDTIVYVVRGIESLDLMDIVESRRPGPSGDS